MSALKVDLDKWGISAFIAHEDIEASKEWRDEVEAGLDPFGFFGKYQGIQIKGKYPEGVANEIVQTILKKPKYRNKLLLHYSLPKRLS